MTALFDVSDPLQEQALKAIEAEMDRAEAGARTVAAELKAKGIAFDVDRMLRGSVFKRAQSLWNDLMFRWRTRDEPEDANVPDDTLFVFDLPVALTYPTSTLNAEYDALDAEVARMVEGLSRQIIVSRGCAPLRIVIPDDLLNELAEAEDWTEADSALIEAGDITAYWPPVGGAPALALSVVHEDGGHVIEVKLLAHGVATHGRFKALLADHGGTLE